MSAMKRTVATQRYRFGRFELQPDEGRLLADGDSVPLGPRAFQVLLTLVENGGRLVTKDVLLDRVWPDAVVVENALQVHVSALRKILGPDAISTATGRGYRFTLPVTEIPDEDEAAIRGAHNLPQQLTSFVGREKAIADVKLLLGRTRLVTLTGMGGCGKTRLALQVARQLTSSYPSGIWFAELAAIESPLLVSQSLARLIGCKPQPNEKAVHAIAGQLGDRRTLILLDNVEHVAEAVADLVEALLQECAQTVFLLTSRERLGVAGESTYRVPSLLVPNPDADLPSERLAEYESVRLFIDRARLQRPHFALGDDNAAALVSVCRQLEGIPLAIELAAPRVRTMSLEEIDRRLDQRLALLTGGPRQGPERQRTVRATLDWSFDLLRRDEQELLRRCSVFVGGWTLDAAEHVCVDEGSTPTDILSLLTALADKSLVLAEEQHATTRFRLLETVRQYAKDRLDESEDGTKWRCRHQTHYLMMAETTAPGLSSDNPWPSIKRLEADRENIRASIEWSARFDPSAGLRMAASLWRFWRWQGAYDEALAVLTRMLSANGVEAPVTRSMALHGAAFLSHEQGKWETARSLAMESLEIRRGLGDPAAIASSLECLGMVCRELTDYEAARTYLEECLAIQRQRGDAPGIFRALSGFQILAQRQGNLVESQSLCEECLAMQRDASTLNNLAVVLRERGLLDRARAMSDESVALLRESREVRSLSVSLALNGLIACDQGQHEHARRMLREALPLVVKVGHPGGVGELLFILGYAWTNEDVIRAARIWGSSERLYELGPDPRNERERALAETRVALTRARLDDDTAFESAWNEGRSMDMLRAVEHALESRE